VSLRRNVIANYLGQGWTALVGLAFIPLYVKYLGIEAYGLIGIFALLQAWLSLLDFGLTPTISREMARFTGGGHDGQSIRDLLRSVEIATVAIAVLVASGIGLSADWLATHWLHAESLPSVVVAQSLAIMGIVVGLRFVEGIYRSSIVGLQRQVQLNLLTSVLATVRALGAVAILAWISPTVIAFFVWQGIVSLISSGAFAIFVHRSLPPPTRASRFSLEPLRSVWRFAAGTLLVTLLGFLLSQSDKVVLSGLLSLGAFGLYSLAYAVASSVRLLAVPIDQAVFPRMAELHQRDDQTALAGLYHKSTQYNAVLMGGVGLFLAVFGREVLALWMRNDALAAQAYPVFWILVIGMVLNGIMNGPYYRQMATGWTDLLVKVNAVMVVVFVPLIYVLTLQYSMIGAAVAWAVLNIAYVLVVARLMHRRLLQGEMWAWYTKDLLAPLSAGAVAALALKSFLPQQSGVVPTLVTLGVALAGILVVSALGAGYLRDELRRRVRFVLARTQ